MWSFLDFCQYEEWHARAPNPVSDSLFNLSAGNIIGSGIFVSPKGVLENASSVGVAIIVWVSTGVITAIGALCYAELGVTIPKSGGDYSYVNDIFGGLAGWGQMLIIRLRLKLLCVGIWFWCLPMEVSKDITQTETSIWHEDTKKKGLKASHTQYPNLSKSFGNDAKIS